MDSSLPLDPYVTLSLSKDASGAAVRSAYRKIILTCHPDKVFDKALKERKRQEFDKVQQAYEILIDDEKRRKYDSDMILKDAKERLSKREASGRREHPVSHKPYAYEVHTAVPLNSFKCNASSGGLFEWTHRRSYDESGYSNVKENLKKGDGREHQSKKSSNKSKNAERVSRSNRQKSRDRDLGVRPNRQKTKESESQSHSSRKKTKDLDEKRERQFKYLYVYENDFDDRFEREETYRRRSEADQRDIERERPRQRYENDRGGRRTESVRINGIGSGKYVSRSVEDVYSATKYYTQVDDAREHMDRVSLSAEKKPSSRVIPPYTFVHSTRYRPVEIRQYSPRCQC